MIDWSTITAEAIRAKGEYVDKIRTSHSVYKLYHYKGYLVQTHDQDDDIAAVWKDGKMVWLHPRTRVGLEKIR